MPRKIKGQGRARDARHPVNKMERSAERREKEVHRRRGMRRSARRGVLKIMKFDRLPRRSDDLLNTRHSRVAVRIHEVCLPIRENLPPIPRVTGQEPAPTTSRALPRTQIGRKASFLTTLTQYLVESGM